MNVLDIANKNEFGIFRVRLLNTIFRSREINAKLMLKFINNNLFSFFHKFEQDCVD